jgi:hypothetical protein
LLLLVQSSLLISDLALLFLLVDGDALADVRLQLSALAGRQLVKLELEDLAAVLVDAVSDDVDDASLLVRGQLADVKLKLVLLLEVHWTIVLSAVLGYLNGIAYLHNCSLVLSTCPLSCRRCIILKWNALCSLF